MAAMYAAMASATARPEVATPDAISSVCTALDNGGLCLLSYTYLAPYAASRRISEPRGRVYSLTGPVI